jgi:predicted nuclease with TOPRIM domain
LRQLPPELQRAILDFADLRAGDVRKQVAEELTSCKQEMEDLAEANEQLTSVIDDLREQLMRTMAGKSNLRGCSSNSRRSYQEHVTKRIGAVGNL